MQTGLAAGWAAHDLTAKEVSMRRTLLTGLLAGMLILALGAAIMAEDAKKVEEPKHEYVGVKKCKICHKKDGIHESWLASKHAYAFDSLSAEDQKNEELLPYYTTGTTAKGDLLTGIQCEACHGPGSDYKKKKTMSDRELAVAGGLIIPDSALCVTCHNDKAPAALAAVGKDFNFEKAKVKGAHAAAIKKEAKKEAKDE
jgi:hypothetical protein